jgi:hypothetical protein
VERVLISARDVSGKASAMDLTPAVTSSTLSWTRCQRESGFQPRYQDMGSEQPPTDGRRGMGEKGRGKLFQYTPGERRCSRTQRPKRLHQSTSAAQSSNPQRRPPPTSRAAFPS